MKNSKLTICVGEVWVRCLSGVQRVCLILVSLLYLTSKPYIALTNQIYSDLPMRNIKSLVFPLVLCCSICAQPTSAKAQAQPQSQRAVPSPQVQSPYETVIDAKSFADVSTFNRHWNYFYPWGSDHNGSARMYKSQISLKDGVLQLRASGIMKAEGNSKSDPFLPIRFHSGAVHAKHQINITKAYPEYVVSGEFRAPITPGTWPAFWLTAVNGWPPESDILEFKGDAVNWQNTFITPQEVTTIKTTVPDAAKTWHSYTAVLKRVDDEHTSITYYLDGVNKGTHQTNFTNKPLWLIINLQMEGSSGPKPPGAEETLFSARNVSVKRLKARPADLNQQIDSALKRAAVQYKYLGTRTPANRYPKTYHANTDELETSNSGWWCSGFYPGTLLLLHEASADPELKKQAALAMKGLEKEQFNKTTHDLGFMMFCSFGNANRIAAQPAYDSILMNSARSLASRYNAKAKSIQSWDSAPWNNAAADELPVIIDNMMNLELLFWATKYSGDSSFYKIAVEHANTTMKNHYRKDFSSFHEVVYKKNTGALVKQITNQGAADDSAWARGQAWGLYGFVVMYRETKDRKYLEQAQHIADFILNHPNLPKDKIPYWDFNAAEIPDALRDSSAGAIIASALLELAEYAAQDKSTRYSEDAALMIQNLLSPEYLAEEGTNGGFLLKHGVGNMPKQSEVDTPLSYGDYYLVEAMLRMLPNKKSPQL